MRYFERPWVRFFPSALVLLLGLISPLALSAEKGAKVGMEQSCLSGVFKSCLDLTTQEEDEKTRAKWLWRLCSFAEQPKSKHLTGALIACADLSYLKTAWPDYRLQVQRLLRDHCTKRLPSQTCVSLGSYARGGRLDPKAEETFLLSECNGGNGNACYGLFALKVKSEGEDFFAPRASLIWLEKACALKDSDSCELLTRVRLDPTHFKFYIESP